MNAPKLTREQLRDLAAEHGYLIIPFRSGVVIEWRDEATGECLASGKLTTNNVVPFRTTKGAVTP